MKHVILCLLLVINIAYSQATDSITILGTKYTISNQGMEDTGLTFSDVRSFVPETLLQPQPPQAKEAILSEVNKLITEYGNIYTQELERLTKEAKPEPKDVDSKELEIAAVFQSNRGEKLSPEAQKAHNTYLALLYIQEFVQNSK